MQSLSHKRISSEDPRLLSLILYSVASLWTCELCILGIRAGTQIFTQWSSIEERVWVFWCIQSSKGKGKWCKSELQCSTQGHWHWLCVISVIRSSANENTLYRIPSGKIFSESSREKFRKEPVSIFYFLKSTWAVTSSPVPTHLMWYQTKLITNLCVIYFLKIHNSFRSERENSKEDVVVRSGTFFSYQSNGTFSSRHGTGLLY